MNNPPQIVLAIPTLQYQKGTVDSLLRVMTDNPFSGFVSITGCLLPYARNKAIELVYQNNPEFTHVMFIDDDMDAFETQSILDLLNVDKDIISGLTVTRRPPHTIPNKIKVTDEDLKNRIVLKVDFVGMAFTLIKREVLDAVREETPEGPIWFTMDREPRESYISDISDFVRDNCMNFFSQKSEDQRLILGDLLRETIIFGRTLHLGSILSGEDFAFCKRAKVLGFYSFVHCGVQVGHVGTRTFTIADILCTEKSQQQSQLVS